MPQLKSPPFAFDALILLLVSIAVVAFSMVQGAYDFDPHHWGLMLSNASDFAEGRIPYKDIFIQYGFLTTAIESWFYSIAHNIQSLIFGVSLLYAFGLIGIYFLALQLSSCRKIALFSLVVAFLIHPLAIYPWPNYVSFPFIVFGCWMIVKDRGRLGFLGGTLLACAVLARETLFAPLAIVILASLPIYLWFSPVSPSKISLMAPLLGFLVPLAAFGGYLWYADLFEYWRLTAIELPKLYAHIFFKDGLPSAVTALLKYIFYLSFSEHIRQTIFALILLSATTVWITALARKTRSPNLVFVALLSGVLFSSALHINEIFRLATSATVGLCLVFIIADRLHVATPLFVALSIGLVVGGFGDSSGNYFLPKKEQIASSTKDNRIALFKGQRWSREIFDYYNWFTHDMRILQSRPCTLRYFRNETRDAFLAILSPYSQYQLAPFGAGMGGVPIDDWSRRLRPDYDLPTRLLARDIIIISSQRADAVADRAIPNGYRIFDRRVTPKSRFLPDGDMTLIVAPEACGPLT